MAIVFVLQILLALSLGTGLWLIFSSYRCAYQRAKALGLWPERQDIPETPKYGWVVAPGWSLALMRDVVLTTSERDIEYLSHRRHFRIGIVLLVASVVGIVFLDKFLITI
jgi:hypothetical protein